jgi:RNA polymerase sigma-70 factor (ECF subfamily)
VGREILPHERELRAWLKRRLNGACDVEDIVQECYCRLAKLDSVAHIAEPRAYLFTMARNLAYRHLRLPRIVRIDAITGLDSIHLVSDEPSPERIIGVRQELARVQRALQELPERARNIFTLRRIEGLSQKEVAARLGVTETIVENDSSRSLRAILRYIAKDEEASESPESERRVGSPR